MSKSLAEETVFNILSEFADEWGLDDLELSTETQLKSDMSFESTDIMQLFLGIQEAFPSVQIPFQSLVMKDGKFIDDLAVRDVIAFVNTEVAKSISAA
ncbi:MAG: hypothetical protein OIF40_04440 [Mangrovicoccus sp.]|nr:hypothetical protein [Mangrovicoccus sp.]